MENAINKGTSTEGVSRAPRSLRTAITARLLAGTMALSAAVLAACSSDEIINPVLVGIGDRGTDGGISLSNDSTSTVDAASDTTATTDGEVEMAGDATTVTVDASDTGADTIETAETASSSDSVDSTSVDSTAIDTTVIVDASTTAKDTTSIITDTSKDSTDIVATADTAPSGPKQVCEAVKAKMISVLKPGAPECSEKIPGVGTKAGVLVCDGTNIEPNCVID